MGKRDKDGALKTFTLFPPKLHWSDNNMIFVLRSNKQGFPGGAVVKNLPAVQEIQAQSLGQEVSLEKDMATHSSILAWEIP